MRLNVLLLGLVIYFLPSLLVLFGANNDILPYSLEYALWCLPGSFGMNVFFVFLNVIRAEGNTKFAMWCQVITAIINLILDPIFIFCFGWGVKGAAIATSISQITSAVLGWWYFSFSKKRVLTLSIPKCFHLPEKRVFVETFSLGSASFGRQFAHSVSAIVINNLLVGVGGTLAIAAYGIINRLTMFVFMPLYGVNHGFKPIAGYNYGAKNYARVFESIKWGVILTSSICVLGFVVFEVFASHFFSIFSSDSALLDYGSVGLRVFVLALPVVGCQVIGSGIFEALGKALPAFLLSIARQLLFLLPLAVVFAKIGENAIWYAFPLADLLSAIVTILLVIKVFYGNFKSR
ncbi:MAG: MATE family efflux transporter, partial [Bacteroidales bacterium]|nr:MATE family efflux transporter [Bacteroidales bacterium]